MVYTVFYKTSSFAGYCFLGKNSIHPKRYGVFSFKAYKVILVKIQICSFIACISNIPNITVSYNREPFFMFLLGKKNFGTAGSYDEGSKQKEKWKYYMPMAVYVSRLNERIRAQSGIFLAYNIYTGPDIRNEFHYIDLEKIQTEYLKQYYGDEDTHPFLYKVIIKEAYRKDIAKWVKTFGMTKEKCYPELSNIGERIMR